MANTKNDFNPTGARTRNPIQPRPEALPEDAARKLGPGFRRHADTLAGPSQQIPSVNYPDQSADAKRLFAADGVRVNVLDPLESKTIDRRRFYPPQRRDYGKT